MIIIEGMDNTGKTTLAMRLATITGLAHGIRVRPKSPDDFPLDVLGALSATPRVQDRHPIISEIVYGPVLRPNAPRHEDLFAWLRVLLKMEPIIVYCRPDDEVILDFGEREQLEGVIDQARTLIRRYDYLMAFISSRMPPRNFFRYDYKIDGMIQKMAPRLVEHAMSDPTPLEPYVQTEFVLEKMK